MSSSDENPTPTIETTTEPEPAKMITLRTSDDQIFEVEELVAMEFVTVKSFLEDNPSSTEIVPLPNASAKPLSQVIEFCKEYIKIRGKPDEENLKTEFNDSFLKEKSNEELVDLIYTVNYLEIKYLLDLLSQVVADNIKNKSVEYVRKFFGIEKDFTDEEEEKIRQENAWVFEDVDAD